MTIQFVLPGFKKPISREVVIAVLQMWQYGDATAFIAENCRVSTKKVTAIIDAHAKQILPPEWVKFATDNKHGSTHI